MIRNKNQLVKYLKTIRANGEEDEKGFVNYCKNELGINVRLGRNENLPVISLRQFKQWLKEGLFERGDAVVDTKRKLTGIISNIGYQTMSLVAYVDVNGVLIRQGLTVSRTDCRSATLEEMFRFQRILYRKGLSWNRHKNKVVKREYEPQQNQHIRISVLGQKWGSGVFKEINKEGQIVMYCVKLEGEDARFSLHEVVGPVEDYQIDPLNTYGRKFFVEELAECGVVWNGHIRQVERIHYRMPEGETYYYLNDMFEVVEISDRYRLRDYRRFYVGNYFINQKEAEKLRDLLLEEAKKGRALLKTGKSRVSGLKAMVKK